MKVAPVVLQYVMPGDAGAGTTTIPVSLADGGIVAVPSSMGETPPTSSTSTTETVAAVAAGPLSKKSYRFPGSRKMKEVDNEKLNAKKAKQAEAARLRYHRLNPDEKKALNLKRTQAQKRKRQREKEMAELEAILRETNDIVDDPEITEQLRERRIRARWAEAARSRYQRMSSEERRAHNVKRRMRQLTVKNEKGEIVEDHDVIKDRIKEQNARKALAARTRYHRMTPEEKKLYNQRRTEAFRRRRLEEEALLAMPIGRINGEALDRAQQIVVRNAKRAEAARLRYQRMTPEERKIYNQKRYTPKRRRESPTKKGVVTPGPVIKQEEDALTSLERDVIRRTQQAQQVIRQRGLQPNGQQQQQQHVMASVPVTSVGPEQPTPHTVTLNVVQSSQGNAVFTSAPQALQFGQNGTIIVSQTPQLISSFSTLPIKTDYS